MTRIHFPFSVTDVWVAEWYNEANDVPNQRPMAVAWLLAGPGGEATLSAKCRHQAGSYENKHLAPAPAPASPQIKATDGVYGLNLMRLLLADCSIILSYGLGGGGK